MRSRRDVDVGTAVASEEVRFCEKRNRRSERKLGPIRSRHLFDREITGWGLPNTSRVALEIGTFLREHTPQTSPCPTFKAP